MNSRNKTLPDDINLDQIEFDVGNLGKGSYSIVRKAVIDEGEFVVKIISTDKSTLYKCEKEKDIMKELTALNSSSIVQYFGHHYDVQNKNYYIIMEYMNLGSLSGAIGDSEIKPFEWGTRLSIMKDIASGIELLHKYKLVHFDINSNNALLSGNFANEKSLTAKLADFGFCKRTTERCKMKGTPDYMAPEVINGTDSVMSASDIFSLAILLWEVGAWRFPHENIALPFKLIGMVANGLRETIPNNFPKRYAKLVTWGWIQAPEKRPTATEVITELTEIEKEMKVGMQKN